MVLPSFVLANAFSSNTFQWAEAYLPPSLITYGYRYIAALVGSLSFVGLAIKCLKVDNATCRMLSYFQL